MFLPEFAKTQLASTSVSVYHFLNYSFASRLADGGLVGIHVRVASRGLSISRGAGLESGDVASSRDPLFPDRTFGGASVKQG